MLLVRIEGLGLFGQTHIGQSEHLSESAGVICLAEFVAEMGSHLRAEFILAIN